VTTSTAARPIVLRSLLAEQIREHLLDGILSGRYPPGSRIVETRVAREVGTSQAPVREALRGLEGIGVVELLPFRGARVRRPTRAEILEAYVVRSAVESLAARLAVPRMTEADLAELEACGAAMEAGARARDSHGVAEADARFHGRIVELAGNRTLERTWRSLEPFPRTYLTMLAPGADLMWSAQLHGPILAALALRDAAGVAAALEEHFREACANMAGRWPEAEGET
jgi:DNA-binding GntR family transcriptional regulator